MRGAGAVGGQPDAGLKAGRGRQTVGRGHSIGGCAPPEARPNRPPGSRPEAAMAATAPAKDPATAPEGFPVGGEARRRCEGASQRRFCKAARGGHGRFGDGSDHRWRGDAPSSPQDTLRQRRSTSSRCWSTIRTSCDQWCRALYRGPWKSRWRRCSVPPRESGHQLVEATGLATTTAGSSPGSASSSSGCGRPAQADGRGVWASAGTPFHLTRPLREARQ